MGLSYSAEVFYGVAVPRHSKLGRSLAELIEAHGGMPAPVERHPGIELYSVGSQGTGEIWIAVTARGSHRSVSRDEEVRAPALLRTSTKWNGRLKAFLSEMGLDAEDTIGWHFGMSVY